VYALLREERDMVQTLLKTNNYSGKYVALESFQSHTVIASANLKGLGLTFDRTEKLKRERLKRCQMSSPDPMVLR